MARKKKPAAEEDNPLRWLATYGDVVTLMLAFFVMLYAISQVDQQKFQMLVSGLESPFGNPAVREGLFTDGDGIVGSASVEIEQDEATAARSVALLDGLPGNDADATEDQPRAAGDELRTPEDLAEVRDAVAAALAAADLADAVDFTIDERGLTVAIATDDVLFASGSSAFGTRGRDIIEAIAPTLAEFTNRIVVEGHTDNVPLDEAGYDNWNLSADRALAVLKLLEGRHQIDPARLAASGFGEFRPKDTNDTDPGRAANRRVELVIVVDDSEAPAIEGGTGNG